MARYTQPELFIPDEDHQGDLMINPDALAPHALAKRAFDMMPVARERDHRLAELEFLETIAQEHRDDNPHPVAVEPHILAQAAASVIPRQTYTRKEERANEAKHIIKARSLRWR